MDDKRSFDIAFVGLKPGIHKYKYEITDEFFERYKKQDFSNCKAIVKLELDKKSSFILLHFEIGGNLKVICDRCGSNFPLKLWDDFRIVVKFVDNPNEMNDLERDSDVYYIGRNQSHLQIADWIYEFINLSIPIQKMCNEEGKEGPYCDKEILRKLSNMKPTSENKDSKTIWKELEKFKNSIKKNI